MSSEYLEGYSDSFVNQRNLVLETRSTGTGRWLPRSAIEHSPSIEMDLLSFFKNCNYPYRLILDIPFEDALASEVRRFFISLDAYIESSNPVIPEKTILYGAASIDFAEYLKRVRRKSFQKSWKAELFGVPEWWNDVPSYSINEIGDIFNYAYLIFWKGETDDYKWGEVDVNINLETLEEFKETLLVILPPQNEVEEVAKEEILLDISSSSSLADEFRHSPNWKLKPKNLTFNKRRDACDRCVIQVSPNNYRDAHILTPPDINTIGWIDKQVCTILNKMPDHIHLTDKDRATRRCRKLLRNYIHFLQRDFRKEGITKPHAIACAIIEVLQKAYPDFDAFKDMEKFYSSYPIRVDGEVRYMKRGHGLGLANGMTTLMNLTLHHMTYGRIRYMYPDAKARCLCLNDDFVVGFDDDDIVDEYWDVEGEIFDELSLIRADDKSFRSYCRYVIAERYFTNLGEDRKESYQLRELLLPLAAYNITHAKEHFLSTQSVVESQHVEKYLGELISYWGYEFYPTEAQTPYQIGGWLNLKLNRNDLSLLEIDSIELKDYHYRGYNATTVSPIIPKKGKMYESPFFKLYPFLHIDEDIADRVNYLPISQVNWKFGRIFSDPNRFRAYWDNMYTRRQKRFKERVDLTYEELIISIINRYRTTQFFPSKTMIDSYVDWDFHNFRVRDLYLDPNPITAALGCDNNLSYPFKEKFSLMFTNQDEGFHIKRGLHSREVERALKTTNQSLFFIGSQEGFMWPRDEEEYSPSEDYLNPIAIGYTCSSCLLYTGYPKLKPRFRNPLIEEKRKVYGRFLSLPEMSFFSSQKAQREMILEYCKLGLSLQQLEELLELRSVEEEPLEFEPEETEPDVFREMPSFSIQGNEVTFEERISALPIASYSTVYCGEDEFTYVTEEEMLESPNGGRFWNWINYDIANILFETDKVERIFKEARCFIIYVQTPGIADHEKRLRELDRIRATDYDLAAFLNRVGADRLASEDNYELASIDEDWGGDLFGEDDE